MKKAFIIPLVYGIALGCFGTYSVLDTLFIPKVKQTVSFDFNQYMLNSHYTLLPFHIIYVSITWAHHTYQRDLFASLYAVSFSPSAFLPTMYIHPEQQDFQRVLC